MTVYYFHETCYNKLLGPMVGGVTDISKVATKVYEAEVKKREKEQKQIWNTIEEGSKKWNHLGDIVYGTPDKQFREEYMSNPDQKICERCGLGMRKLTPQSDVWICSNKHTEQIVKHPKGHVEEFEPSQDTKDDHLNLIIAEIRARGELTSEQLEEFTGVKRSTITWRLWEHTIGNAKSKNNQELFYFDKAPKGVQIYGLVSERIKDPNFFGKARLRQQAKENGISYEKAKNLYDCDFLDDTDILMTNITEGAKEKPYSLADLKKKEDLLDKAIKITPDYVPPSPKEIEDFSKNTKKELARLLEEEE